MIRTLSFLLAICCCIGLISGTYSAIAETGDDVTFREEVLFGDPAVMDGRTAKFGVNYGEHLLWQFEYRFGPEDSHDTNVIFSQTAIPESVYEPHEVLSIYAHSGWGASTSGSFDMGTSDYAAMFQTVAALTPKGGQKEMNLRLKDFIDYHALNFDLNYRSDRYICVEFVDMFAQLSGVGVDFQSPSYTPFNQLFRFPVQEEEIATVSVWVNDAGGVDSLNYDSLSDYTVAVVNCATDEGLYCIPVYRNEKTGEAIPGDYSQGMGLYFIPWVEYDDGSVYDGGLQCVTMGVSKARNICPLPEDTTACGLSIDEERGYAWLLTLEDGQYFLTRLSLDTKQPLDRFPLMAHDPEAGSYRPQWYIREELMAVYAGGQLALISTGGAPSLEFIVPIGDTATGFYYLTTKTCAMVYEDGILYLADTPYYNNHLNVMAFDRSGPLFWGNYFCSLYDCNEQGGSALTPFYARTELE